MTSPKRRHGSSSSCRRIGRRTTGSNGERRRSAAAPCHLDHRHRLRLAELSTPVRFAAGEFVFRENEPATRCWLLGTGSVVLTTLVPGRGTVALETCTECKRRGLTCVMVADGTPCLGPVTHSGCGALCPSVARGCYGCFGPTTDPNLAAMSGWLRTCGMNEDAIGRIFATFNVAAYGSEGHDRGAPE